METKRNGDIHFGIWMLLLITTPIFLTHVFTPATQALYIGDGSSVHNNIDFEDISSFQTSGYVRHKNTNCFLEGASVKVDGNRLIKVFVDSNEKDVNVLIILEDEKPLQTEIDKFVNNYKTQKFAFDGIFAMLGSHDCRLDDEMDISADGTYQYNGGRSLCGNEDDQRIKAGTWALDEKLRFVIFDRYEARKFQADINFLSDTMVALSGSYMGVPVSGEYVPR